MPNLLKYIKSYPDFPKKGIIFRDISPLLADPEAFASAIDALATHAKTMPRFDKIVAIDARGFILGGALADRLHKGLIMSRKPAKLPGDLSIEKYGYEYSRDAMTIQKQAIKTSEKFLIVDDVLASGNTILAAYKLINRLGGKVAGILCLLELEYLHGRQFLQENIKDAVVTTVLSLDN
ncbi:adenine phosphoribosyltransferase [Candidatus Saccharibacteria bacterium RIFCSPHIGHO2_12_FULL_47_16b]|nr:MAG: adenine phosphoribosyltransferase [Candidatus Saccharibacteria bacterium RIFCSPHIGHO2_12_FULL_47_16b]